MNALQNIKGLLIDLEGVLYIGDRIIDGTPETLHYLRSKKVVCRFFTNTTTKSVETLHRKIVNMGFDIEKNEIISAPHAAVLYLRKIADPTCYLLLSDDAKRDFTEFQLAETNPQYIVVGDIGNAWDYDLVNKLFQMIMHGAKLIALHKGRFWKTEDGLRVDIGVFIDGLEYATGKQAVIMGKPSKSFFDLALQDMHLSVKDVAIIGDDIDSDVGGGMSCGLEGILVKTGKYREDYVAESNIKPDMILESLNELKRII